MFDRRRFWLYSVLLAACSVVGAAMLVALYGEGAAARQGGGPIALSETELDLLGDLELGSPEVNLMFVQRRKGEVVPLSEEAAVVPPRRDDGLFIFSGSTETGGTSGVQSVGASDKVGIHADIFARYPSAIEAIVEIAGRNHDRVEHLTTDGISRREESRWRFLADRVEQGADGTLMLFGTAMSGGSLDGGVYSDATLAEIWTIDVSNPAQSLLIDRHKTYGFAAAF